MAGCAANLQSSDFCSGTPIFARADFRFAAGAGKCIVCTVWGFCPQAGGSKTGRTGWGKLGNCGACLCNCLQTRFTAERAFLLQEIKQAVSIPVYGIGGIHVQNAAQVQAIGADGICMMSDWMQAEEPEQLMQQLRAIKPEEQR